MKCKYCVYSEIPFAEHPCIDCVNHPFPSETSVDYYIEDI